MRDLRAWVICGSSARQLHTTGGVLVTGLSLTLIFGGLEHYLQAALSWKAYCLILAGAILGACFLAWREQFLEREKLCKIPPEIVLVIQDVVMHRTGDQELKWKNGEFFVQASAELLNLPSATVEYSAQLVYRGEVIELAAIKDIREWKIIERKYYQQLYPSMSRPRQNFVTNPAAITENLSRSIRNEGWLHFQIEGMSETDIAKRTLRLYATAKGGACSADEELAKHHVVQSDLVAMRKIYP